MKKPIFEQFAEIERYMLYLPDQTEVIVDVYTDIIAGATVYDIRNRNTLELIEDHLYQTYVEEYFEELTEE